MYNLRQNFREKDVSQEAHGTTQRLYMHKMPEVCYRIVKNTLNSKYKAWPCPIQQQYHIFCRDCRTHENLLKHICVAPPQQPVRRVKKILDLTNNNYHEIADLAKELHDMTKKGGTIKSGKRQMDDLAHVWSA